MAVPVQAGGAKNVFPGGSLMLQIVERVANARVPHAQVLIDFVQKHRRQACLPIVAMNNLRMLLALEHELERGAAEKGEPLVIIPLPVKHTAVEEMMLRMRFDKETLAPVNKAEINAAVDGLAIPGHPQVAKGETQVVNLVVAQAIVLGQDNLNGVSANLQLSGEAENDVRQPSHFGDGGALGR